MSSSTNDIRKTGSLQLEMTLESYLSLWTTFNPKWIKDQGTNPEVMELLEEKLGSTLWDLSTGM